MEIYIDTANLDEIKQAAEMGILDGVTTNPSLIAKEKVPYAKRLAEICEVVKGPVSAEVIATDLEGMLKEGASTRRSPRTSSSSARRRSTASRRARR